MGTNLWRICVLSSVLVSVLSSNQTNSTTGPIIDPRIQLMPEDNGKESDGLCPIEDVSVYMTGCWVDSFNVWQLNITDITPNGVVRGSCQSSPECGLKFCCAAFQAMKCFSTIGRHFCTTEFARMGIHLGLTFSRICGDSVPENKCQSILSISDSTLKRVADQTDTGVDISEPSADEKEPMIQVVKEPELQKITIQLRFNGSIGVVSSAITVLALLVISALFT